MSWYEIKFLESAGNIKGLLKKVFGMEPSSKITNDISVCVQHGRMFFQTAATAPLEIRPLQIFYGIMGFAKAVYLSRNIVSLDTLKASHGIRDVSAANSTIKNLKLTFKKSGTFQNFNNTISEISRIYYFAKSATPDWRFIPFSNSDKLINKTISLKEILARTPYLQHFGMPANSTTKAVRLPFSRFLSCHCFSNVSFLINSPVIHLSSPISNTPSTS